MQKLIINLTIAILTFVIGTIASALFYGISPSAGIAKRPTVALVQRPAPLYKQETISNGCGCQQASTPPQSEEALSTADQSRAPISGGVLNSKALNLPSPQYPAIARAAHATGSVAVEVVVDERGCIESAHAVGGHPLLQSAAVQAAYQACFTPTRLSGRPVKVSGVLTYNFLLQ